MILVNSHLSPKALCCILTLDRAVNQVFHNTGCNCFSKFITGKQVIHGLSRSRGLTTGRTFRRSEFIYTQIPTSERTVLKSRSLRVTDGQYFSSKKQRCRTLNMNSQCGLRKGQYSSPPESAFESESSVCLPLPVSVSLPRSHKQQFRPLREIKWDVYIFVKKVL